MMSQKQIGMRSFVNQQQIFQLVQQEKSYKIVQINLEDSGFDDNIYRIIDKDSLFSLKVTPLYDEEDSSSLNKDKLKEAQMLADQFKSFAHQNIIEYHSQFQIDNYCFFQFKSFSQSLLNWINTKDRLPINSNLFIKIALQLLEATQCLHNNNFVLQWLSPNNILIDKNDSVQISNFGKPQSIEQNAISTLFFESLKSNKLFFPPPEFLDEKCNIAYYGFDIDIWQVGICLYALAGASFKHIQNYIQYKEPFQIQENLDCSLNAFLANIILRNPFKKRPQIPYLIQYLKNIIINSDEKKESVKNFMDEKDKEFVSLFIQGMNYLQQKEYQNALDCLSKCQEINPKNEIPYFYKSQIYNSINDYQMAITCCNKLIEINPQCDSAFLQLGNAYSSLNQPLLAKHNYIKSIQINQKNDFSFYNLGIIYHDENDWQKAIEQYNQAIMINPRDEDYYYNLGNSYQENYDPQSIFCYKKSIEINPKNEKVYYNLANAYYQNNQDDQACIYYKKSLELNPNRNESFNNIGNIYFFKYQYFKALQYYKKALKQYSKNYLYHYNLGSAYGKNENYEKAIKHFKKGININNEDQDAQNDREFIEFKTCI